MTTIPLPPLPEPDFALDQGDELNGKPSVMLEGMRNITTKLGSQP